MSELKRCPFCGGEAELDCNNNFGDWFVRCTKCFCKTPKFFVEHFAIVAWNTRKPMKRIVERLEEELRLADEEKRRCVAENMLQFDSAKGYANGIYNAIETVKEEGGMNE